MAVHSRFGPGLLESIYEQCLAVELEAEGFRVERQRQIPLTYRGVNVEPRLRIDIVVENRLIIEVKAVERLLPVHCAQVVTYLKLTSLPTALLINFNVVHLRDGLRRFSNRNLLSPPLLPSSL